MWINVFKMFAKKTLKILFFEIGFVHSTVDNQNQWCFWIWVKAFSKKTQPKIKFLLFVKFAHTLEKGNLFDVHLSSNLF